MCFGVRDALTHIRSIETPRSVTVHGELVHNPSVLEELSDRGFQQSAEGNRAVPKTDAVLITAHGVSDRERQRLEAAGKTLIDTTCPLVADAHQAARRLASEGRHVVVFGKASHVEVRGLVEDLPSFDVFESPGEVRPLPSKRLGVICQTTLPPDRSEALRLRLEALHPDADIRFVDTICRPTKARQAAVRELVRQVDAVVVVGGRNSNNTRQLVELCHRLGTAAWSVEGPSDVKPEWLEQRSSIGLTAGTSTLDDAVDAVEAAIYALAATTADT